MDAIRRPLSIFKSQREKDVDLERVQTSTSTADVENLDLERTSTVRTIGRLTLRGKNDDLPQSWWFASTAIPLLAATLGPLANVLSIAALVSTWRADLPNGGVIPEGSDAFGVPIPDPRWEIAANAASLACGFIGNFFLLLNFVQKVRYIVALPMSIIFWFLASGILTAILICMHIYSPPVGPSQTYSQGFWHAVLAAILYWIGAIILMINMLGYFLGKYPQHFDLDDSQRTLILQTMMFFFWLAAGAGIFSKLCGFSYADALYFCDVTVLTIGFGDFTSTNDAGRGFVFPYTIIGIIFLGLMINSIRKFAASMSRDKVVKAHALHERARTFGRTVTNEVELRERLGLPPRRPSDTRRPSDARRPSSVRNPSTVSGIGSRQQRSSIDQYGYFEMQGRVVTFHEHKKANVGGGRGGAGRNSDTRKPLSRDEKIKARKEGGTPEKKRAHRRERLLLLREEKDRFDMMREIQANTHRFKRYYALMMSVLAFTILWFVGALIFMLAESREQGMTYFEALYFCYVSLLTIGYGDFSPKSNFGKPFFVLWSLIAIPTMTILISDMGDTVVAAINRGTFTLADWTVMPREGVWHDFLEHHPDLKAWIEKKFQEIAERKRIKAGFDVANPDMDVDPSNTGGSISTPHATLEELATNDTPTDHELARKLAITIKHCAHDLHDSPPKKYCYEEWVEFTRLIRFSANSPDEVKEEEEDEGLVEWDWIGEDSPMLADMTEAEWVLDRLCESLNRYTRKQARKLSEYQSTPSPNLRNRGSNPRASGEKYVFSAGDPKEEDEIESSSSGSGSSKVKDDEKSSTADSKGHWSGLDPEHKKLHGPRPGLVTQRKESDSVLAWEAKIAKARAESQNSVQGEEKKAS